MQPLLGFWLAAGVLGVGVTLLVLKPAVGGAGLWWPRAVAALLLPLAAVLSYARLGAPGAIGRDQPPPHRQTEADMATMVQRLSARLQAQPEDLPGWFTLARSLEVLERWDDAATAWREALRLAPEDADLLADAADAVATAQGGQLDGEPAALVARALKAEPKHPKALALAATAAQRAGRREEAIALWERLLAQMPPEAEAAQRVRESLAKARGAAAP
ncbi:tetratricopeptide repeat protein [Azohydromonas caseinilytica]|uniref:Tetratricopeptide repeat protein n=1 Tax=Azohydromonas caseinilytica TaxID=2728836 RepID=A0A848FGB5_9BURK|nr:tetratricopeptide repeat protein [Azohydromonas caseinilytica]NML18404.1 tetratricopeptide repeat protein [Azohydromonas caseinilytica]